jgi:hypothetical protein
MTRQPRYAIGLLAGMTALATLLSACSIPARPMWWPASKHTAPTAAPSATPDRQPSAASQAPVPTVQDPWHTGMPQLGIQVYWTANQDDGSDAVVQAKARRIINYAISLNANSIAISFPFYTGGITSDEVYAESGATPTAAHIAIFLAQAAQSHIRVTLRPILDEEVLVAENPLAWRGSIEPSDRAAWFRNYRKLLLPYAAVAQAGHAATLVLGTELESLEDDSHWHGLIKSIRTVYSGQLTYDENYDEFAANDSILPLHSYDIDAYPRFDLPDSASVATLTHAWDAWLGAHPIAVRRKLTLTEVGIDAVADSYGDPGAWLSTINSPIDAKVQANWYRAVCDAISAEQIGGGVYWWEVNFDVDPADPGPFLSDRLTFVGRPAQQVIRNCFTKLSS